MSSMSRGCQILRLASGLGFVSWSKWSVVEGNGFSRGEDKVGGQCAQQPHSARTMSVAYILILQSSLEALKGRNAFGSTSGISLTSLGTHLLKQPVLILKLACGKSPVRARAGHIMNISRPLRSIEHVSLSWYTRSTVTMRPKRPQESAYLSQTLEQCTYKHNATHRPTTACPALVCSDKTCSDETVKTWYDVRPSQCSHRLEVVVLLDLGLPLLPHRLPQLLPLLHR